MKRRFQAKVEIDHASGCWLWVGSMDGAGYGQLNVDGRPVKAHRLAYQLYVGEIPEGLQIDHLCRVQRCVNPEHLEPVTAAENNRRKVAATWAPKSHCRNGHRLAGRNLRVTRRGRDCVTCRNASTRRWRQRRKATA